MRLHFKTLGRGQPLVILHGLFGSLENWLGVAPKLGEHFQVVLVDLRNHGQSPHRAEMNYPLMAEDVAGFFEEQGLVDASVVGHSMGGKVAMQLALSHPAQVKKLVVVDMAPRQYPPSHAAIIAALLAVDLGSFQARHQIEEALAPAIPNLVVRRFLLKNLGRYEAGNLLWKINLRGIAENYPQLGEALSAAGVFEKPALFLRGGKSNFVTAADEPMIRRWFPQAEMQVIEAAAHWVHADRPEEFAARVLNFLRVL